MIRNRALVSKLGWHLNANTFNVAERHYYADKQAEMANPLRREGYQMFQPIPRDDALALAERFRDKPFNQEGTLEHFLLDDILAQPELIALVTSPVAVNAAAMWIGAPPKILMMSMWRSRVNPGEPEQAQNWHRDMDDFRCCKLYVYLSDVTPDTGPHMLMPGTHRPELFEDVGLPPDRYFVAAAREERMIDELKAWPTVEFTGPAGTCWVENTYCLHKGAVPVSGERVVFQALFGLNDFAQAPDAAEKIAAALAS